jgi:hypothetical protein
MSVFRPLSGEKPTWSKSTQHIHMTTRSKISKAMQLASTIMLSVLKAGLHAPKPELV